MNMIFDVCLDALIDALKLVPFLFLAYLLMEFVENRASEKMQRSLSSFGKAGPVVGSVLGLFPQCGFSASAANLYAAGIITTGTLIAVFLSTSDEAILLLFSSSNGAKEILKLLAVKLVIGIIFGFAVDGVLRLCRFKKKEIDLCENCGCDEGKGILRSAIYHTVRIFVFILVINLILGFAMALIGEENFVEILQKASEKPYLPFLTALVGLIPNCGPSVIITELYISGGLSFGSAVAGLCSGAGIGLAVLFKSNTERKENFMILGILYALSSLSGFAIQLLGIG